MISIIVSSYNIQNYTAFVKSVTDTIGVEHEIIKIHNQDLMGISSAYNLGANKAKFPILCFSHEDIVFHIKNWGTQLLKQFNDNVNIGIIGVAGGAYKAYIPSGWFSSLDQKLNCSNVDYFDNQHFAKKKESSGLAYQEVVTVDGCFIATRFDVWNSHKFDEKTFQGYHCYDLDYCLNVGRSYKIIVSNYIFIRHRSHGNFNEKWLRETYKLHKKWHKFLPRYINIEKSEVRKLEIQEFKILSYNTFQYKSNIFNLFKVLLRIKTLQSFGIINWMLAIISMLKKLKFLILENRQAL